MCVCVCVCVYVCVYIYITPLTVSNINTLLCAGRCALAVAASLAAVCAPAAPAFDALVTTLASLGGAPLSCKRQPATGVAWKCQPELML